MVMIVYINKKCHAEWRNVIPKRSNCEVIKKLYVSRHTGVGRYPENYRKYWIPDQARNDGKRYYL